MTKDTWALKRTPIYQEYPERISEFIKDYQKTEMFPTILKYLKHWNFKQISGPSVLHEKVDTNDYKLQIMLQTNGVDKVKSKLNGLKYTNQEVKDIVIDSIIKLGR